MRDKIELTLEAICKAVIFNTIMTSEKMVSITHCVDDDFDLNNKFFFSVQRPKYDPTQACAKTFEACNSRFFTIVVCLRAIVLLYMSVLVLNAARLD